MQFNSKLVAAKILKNIRKPHKGMLKLLPDIFYNEYFAVKLNELNESLALVREMNSFVCFDFDENKEQTVIDAERVMIRKAQILAGQISLFPAVVHVDLINFVESSYPEICDYLMPAYYMFVADH